MTSGIYGIILHMLAHFSFDEFLDNELKMGAIQVALFFNSHVSGNITGILQIKIQVHT